MGRTKKITESTQEDEVALDTFNETADSVATDKVEEATSTDPESTTDTTVTEGPEEEIPPVIEEAMQLVPPAALQVLRVFSRYETLYVDDMGGAYVGPHPASNAKKYTNPYYKK